MDEFLKVLIEIGVFLIIGQTILHFRPRKQYEKYMKTIISLMVLSQLVVPIFSLLDKDYEMKINEAVVKYQKELEEFEEEQLSVQLEENVQVTKEIEAFELQLKNEIEEILVEESLNVEEMDVVYEGEEQMITLYLEKKGEIAIETIAIGEPDKSGDEIEPLRIEGLKNKIGKAIGVEPKYVEIYLE